MQPSTINIGVEVRRFNNFLEILTMKKKVNTTLNMNFLILEKKNKDHFPHIFCSITLSIKNLHLFLVECANMLLKLITRENT